MSKITLSKSAKRMATTADVVQTPSKKVKKPHWTEAFFKHVDALGDELRRVKTTKAG